MASETHAYLIVAWDCDDVVIGASSITEAIEGWKEWFRREGEHDNPESLIQSVTCTECLYIKRGNY